MIKTGEGRYLCTICEHMYPEQKLAEECEESHLTTAKIKKAIEITEKVQSNMKRNKYCSPDSLQAVNISILAMSRLTPQQPHIWGDKGWCCPVCRCKIDKWESVVIFCSRCGQAIGNED